MSFGTPQNFYTAGETSHAASTHSPSVSLRCLSEELLQGVLIDEISLQKMISNFGRVGAACAENKRKNQPVQTLSPTPHMLDSLLLQDTRRTSVPPPGTTPTSRFRRHIARTASPGANEAPGDGGSAQRSHSNNASTGSQVSVHPNQVSTLRQHVAQLNADATRRSRMLEEKDADLERAEAKLSSIRDALHARESALNEARRALAEREAALRERDAQLAAMDARHAEALALTGQQVAAARESRDEEIARLQGELVAAEEARREAMAGLAGEYEAKLAKAAAVEAELRVGTRRLREDNEVLRSSVQRAEAKASESDLAAKRAVAQFESALGTLRQLESQFDALSADAESADRLRAERILQLETENEALRTAKAAAEAETRTLESTATDRVRRAMAEADEARASQARAELAAADAVHAAARERQELQDAASRAEAAEAAAARWREEAAAVGADLERLRGSYGGAQSLLEATKLALEASRREASGLRSDLDRARAHAAAAESQLASANEAAEEAKREAVGARQRVDRLNADLESVRSRADAVEQRLLGRIEIVQAELEVAQRHASRAMELERRLETEKQLENAATSATIQRSNRIEHAQQQQQQQQHQTEASPGVGGAQASGAENEVADVFDDVALEGDDSHDAGTSGSMMNDAGQTMDARRTSLSPQSGGGGSGGGVAAIDGLEGHRRGMTRGRGGGVQSSQPRYQPSEANRDIIAQKLAAMKLTLLGAQRGRGGGRANATTAMAAGRRENAHASLPASSGGAADRPANIGQTQGGNVERHPSTVADDGEKLARQSDDRGDGLHAGWSNRDTGFVSSDGSDESGSDALTRARQQVRAAKEYLRHVAGME